MRKPFIIAAVSAAIALAQAATAADLPVKAPSAPAAAPYYNWSGFYLGGQFGYLWGRTRVEENGVVTDPGAKTNGAIGGLLAGYYWQTGPYVFGLEADVSWTNAHGTGATSAPPPNTYDINWNSHGRGIFGYALNNWLLYIAGGVAVADFAFHEGGLPTVRGAKYVGGSIGAGTQVLFTPNFVGRLEYLYDDYGSKTYDTGGDIYRVRLTGQTVRGALIWQFGSRP